MNDSIKLSMANSSIETGSSRLEQVRRLLSQPSVGLALIAVCVFAIYYATASFEFVWDDFSQIVDNPLLRSWNFKRVFLSDLWFHTAREQVYYRPLFVLWSILNLKIFGLKSSGWHLSTILLHIGATCMVFPTARKLNMQYWPALLATLLFGLHPIHIETVAWISSGSDSMVTIFYLFAFIAYLKTREPQTCRRWAWQFVSYFALVCALLTKEMAVTFPVMIAVYECLTPREELFRWYSRFRRSVVPAIPYLVITAGYLVLRVLVLHRATQLDNDYTNFDVIVSWPIVLFSYLRLLLFPKGLTGLYEIPYAAPPGFWNFGLPLVLLMLAVGLIWVWSRRSRDGLIGFLGLWMIVSLIPILHLRAFAAGAAVRDRYVYLGSVAFAMLSAKAILAVTKRFTGRLCVAVQFGIVAGLCVAYGIGIWTQQIYWATDFMVFFRGYSLYPQNTYAALNVAEDLIKMQQYDSAAAILTRSSRRSRYRDYVLAKLYARVNKPEEARNALETGLRVAPDILQSNAGKTEVAILFAEIGDSERALYLFGQVLEQEPDLYSAVYNCGYTYFLIKHDSEAEPLLLHAVELLPSQPSPYFYLGQLYLRTGRTELAEMHLRKALSLNPDGYDYHYRLGRALEAGGKTEQAHTEFAEELKLHPKNSNAIAALPSSPQGSSGPN